jgi:hypothetical protein
MFYLAVLPTFLLLVYSDAEDIFREDPLGKGNVRDFSNRGWYSNQEYVEPTSLDLLS